MATRRARELEFQQWYGSAKGLTEWERAGAQEPGTAGLDPETQQSAPTATLTTPSAPTGTRAPAGAQEPGATSIVPVLFAPSDIDRFRSQTHGYGGSWSWDELHRAARRELEHQILIRHDAAGHRDPGANPATFLWQEYVAMLPQATDLVGPGITSCEAHCIKGTTDPRRWRLRSRTDFLGQA